MCSRLIIRSIVDIIGCHVFTVSISGALGPAQTAAAAAERVPYTVPPQRPCKGHSCAPRTVVATAGLCGATHYLTESGRVQAFLAKYAAVHLRTDGAMTP